MVRRDNGRDREPPFQWDWSYDRTHATCAKELVLETKILLAEIYLTNIFDILELHFLSSENVLSHRKWSAGEEDTKYRSHLEVMSYIHERFSIDICDEKEKLIVLGYTYNRTWS